MKASRVQRTEERSGVKEAGRRGSKVGIDVRAGLWF
jgi:hypothetical protein